MALPQVEPVGPQTAAPRTPLSAAGIDVDPTNAVPTMSAIHTADRMQSGDEPVASSDPGSTAFGNDLSSRLRASSLSSGPGDTELPPGSSDPELGPLSPELALIDPELARAARKLLPDGPRAVPVEHHPAAASVAEPAAVNDDLRVGLEPIPDVGRPRRRVWLGWVPTAAGFIVLGAVLTLLVRNEWRLLPREEPQSAGATSPPPAARTEPLPATTAAPPAATATEPPLTATAPAPTTAPPASTAPPATAAPPPAKTGNEAAPTATTTKPATTAAGPAPTPRTPVAPSPARSQRRARRSPGRRTECVGLRVPALPRRRAHLPNAGG